jgi:Uma2 family endonuclease
MVHNPILARRYNDVVIGAIQDVMVFSEQEFELLPDEGRWEVVDGRAILLSASEYEHQRLSDRLARVFEQQLEVLKCGSAVSAPNVFLPRRLELLGGFQSRVPDVVVSKHRPNWHFSVGASPELVIEILTTRRGNVERTEKLDDYGNRPLQVRLRHGNSLVIIDLTSLWSA